MNKFIFPLKLRMKGPAAGDQQQALSSLELVIDKEESATQRFGLSTRTAVITFQENHRLEPTGEVAERTATLINREIESGTGIATPQNLQSPRLLSPNARGNEVRALHEMLLNLGNSISENEQEEQFYGPNTQNAVKQFQVERKIPQSRDFDKATVSTLIRAAKIEIVTVTLKGEGVNLSKPVFNIDKNEVMNLVAPDSLQPQGTKYKCLTDYLGPFLGEKKTAAARETADRQDSTPLNQARMLDIQLNTDDGRLMLIEGECR
ncbi:peptidoglycan-binding domain-containing protein [Methanogenium organophilum]|uniref:Peptidoglycan-binding protein n=1 Tax=Methanogenium organophilum TaxID=2199 RepID=A0A9X9S360_METOG|nr:peptidoglycan-binding protein [Methanogenium organophilum]WAI00933.1 peptidoglycan-binding protein [Methanogenium organophilum]